MAYLASHGRGVETGRLADGNDEIFSAMYLILHAFSRRNAGDGLLVDLTFEALADAGINRTDCALVALDPESFNDVDQVYRAPGEPSARPSLRLAMAGLEVLSDAVTAGGLGQIDRLARDAQGLVGVGGGYLVADTPIRQLGVLFNHLVQVKVAGRSRAPTIYLPQSIGPLHGPVGRMTAHHLRRIDRLYVRDDLTLAEVRGAHVRRCSDLAVMKLARDLARSAAGERGDASTVIVGRDLPKAGDYVGRLRRLGAVVNAPRWAVQADLNGRRSDRAFYQRNGFVDGGDLSCLLAQGRPGVVVSVRLHGAISSLIAGRPAIHLAYERKGWGAYEDLGIAAYAHDARTFDPDAVAAQARDLHDDPEPFWTRVHKAAPALRTQYDAMVSDMRARLVG